MSKLVQFVESGASAVKYALMLSLFVLAIHFLAEFARAFLQ
jgi:hypothetical protein